MLKKRFMVGFTAALLGLVPACAGPGATQESSDITLVFADNFSTTNPVGAGAMQPFIAHVREHGPAVGLDVDYFGAGQLGKQKDVLTLLQTGAVDLAPVIPSYLVNELPMTTVVELPGLADDYCVAARSILPMMQPGGVLYEEELAKHGVMALSTAIVSGYEIYTADQVVTEPGDLRGKLIRSTGGMGDRIVSALGASPVAIGASDLYEALSRQTVSGAYLPSYAVPSYSLEEVVTNGTDGAELGGNLSFLAINPETWNRLTDSQRQVLKEAAEIAQSGVCGAAKEAAATATEKMRAAGVDLFQVDAQAKASWQSVTRTVRDQWVEDLTSAGLPAMRVLTDLEARLEENDQ